MKLSIITINYNNAKGLERTLKSVLSSNWNDYEYIVIDGGSSDESKSIIENHADDISYWISESDNGIYDAMNKGIARAKGEYLLFVNSGDIVNKGIDTEFILNSLTGEELVYFDVRIVQDEAKDRLGYVKSYPKILDFKYFIEDSLPHPSTFIKREMLVGYGSYNNDMRVVSDWAFFMDAVCLLGCSYKHVDYCMSTFFGDGVSSQPENYKKLWAERDLHIQTNYPLYSSLYKDWSEKCHELYQIKSSKSITFLKKMGFLKWLKL